MRIYEITVPCKNLQFDEVLTPDLKKFKPKPLKFIPKNRGIIRSSHTPREMLDMGFKTTQDGKSWYIRMDLWRKLVDSQKIKV